mmetsp:Transcript_24285/g.70017  ORF Transcript_24285/g.70017 Transcript_24285/m.70017 type:complete len:402 (+) Transcript_24285:234-1439(+)
MSPKRRRRSGRPAAADHKSSQPDATHSQASLSPPDDSGALPSAQEAPAPLLSHHQQGGDNDGAPVSSAGRNGVTVLTNGEAALADRSESDSNTSGKETRFSGSNGDGHRTGGYGDLSSQELTSGSRMTTGNESGSGTTGSTGTTVPGASGTRLLEGGLSYRGIRTPMSVFRTVVEQDAIRKKALLKPHSGYLLCQINRTRQDYGGFPHHYVLRNDSDKEPVLWATVRDEHSDVRIFDKEGCCEAFDAHYVGMVEPNFWGTSFVVHDWGVPLYLKKDRLGKQLPMPERKKLLDVKFDTNILGDCPRHIMVTLDRDGEHCEMENIAPKWDPALNSYALPFYGRVKLASAKNFQLVRKGDQNDIMLMFGKISKDVFSLDFRHPLTRLDAFAISIAAMAKKRAVA